MFYFGFNIQILDCLQKQNVYQQRVGLHMFFWLELIPPFPSHTHLFRNYTELIGHWLVLIRLKGQETAGESFT